MRTAECEHRYMVRDPVMSAEEFRQIQRRLRLADRALADNLGLSPRNGDVTIRRIKNGDIPVSGPICTAMLAFEAGFRPPWWRE